VVSAEELFVTMLLAMTGEEQPISEQDEPETEQQEQEQEE
jgi:hypothetical protein